MTFAVPLTEMRPLIWQPLIVTVPLEMLLPLAYVAHAPVAVGVTPDGTPTVWLSGSP